MQSHNRAVRGENCKRISKLCLVGRRVAYCNCSRDVSENQENTETNFLNLTVTLNNITGYIGPLGLTPTLRSSVSPIVRCIIKCNRMKTATRRPI